jgi:uncharacterized protein with PQ loop repeat
MNAVTLLAVTTTVWGVVMALSPVLQIRRIRATRSSLGVSTLQVAVITFGNGLWLAYGVTQGLLPVVIANVLALLLNGVWLLHILRYRPWARRTGRVVAPVGEPAEAAAS